MSPKKVTYMALFRVGAENSNDEVTQYKMGRYVNSNEAIWHIFSFTIHERHPIAYKISHWRLNDEYIPLQIEYPWP